MKRFLCFFTIIILCLCGCEKNAADNVIGSCSFKIRCETILDNSDKLNESKKEFVPESGILCEKENVAVTEETTPFSLLTKICKEEKIKVEFSENIGMNTKYVTAINNISSGDVGEMSGWLYYVNGESVNDACNVYEVQDGDVIEWIYTCDMGNDI